MGGRRGITKIYDLVAARNAQGKFFALLRELAGFQRLVCLILYPHNIC